MTIKYLLDENMSSVYREQLLRYQPELTVLMVGDPNTSTRGTKDPEILHWCEQINFILVTKNRSSMPVHLIEHLAQGYHVPGIFVLRRQAEIGQVIEDLILIAAATEENEYQDQNYLHTTDVTRSHIEDTLLLPIAEIEERRLGY